mmetsp:Transcript_113572/g.220211  ORF Transcript_113572/g.220211 Transcript_113572/m.220211 type:complete len:172 (-) Transcript_113572:127-642(-)|eukprot:CAMPEP_0172677456 /NCGR_PEP_ID=MMETSP1074-20121228/14680_1 /TAXON_ID=2916 /ORGANISM="Ceratium fusus, Strain PA161109" /LENGTH=171 /DNA_ID=CAMNT_0013495285 /DNA_START=49 /DNA_END=564 /DNA_ORIENTATION=-
MWGNSLHRAVSAPAFNAQPPPTETSDATQLGEIHIRTKLVATKDRQKGYRTKLDNAMRESRSDFFSTQFIKEKRKETKTVSSDSQPKFVGVQANELSKWMNAESITRHKEEMNVNLPTLRRVLKIDDAIPMRQMTKSQLAALPFDPTDQNRLKVHPGAVQRGFSYRKPRHE